MPAAFAVNAEMVAWARARVPRVDGRRETEKFRNYWQAKSGASAVKRDWPATWRNWMLTADERLGDRSSPGGIPADIDPAVTGRRRMSL